MPQELDAIKQEDGHPGRYERWGRFRLNIGVVQSGEVSGEILKHFPVPKGATTE